MNKNKVITLISALCILLLISACGTKTNSESTNTPSTKPTDTIKQEDPPVKGDTPANTDKEILIIIDQTPKPSEGHSFDFVVNKRPEGYALAEMQWISDKRKIVNTIAEAIEHGGNGEDGFYISGNGQFSGFFYPDKMKDEKGQVVFIFKNEQGNELTWKKTITLN